ncbi:hypothetical protein ACKGJY_01980 [Hyunsoonleella sp. 2307UL5-6]|uniref:hypothetical protein n=1 Tax=Hyunsoonleella sp. 2307UL5-6 TaxID=3384768 RepID=UPI0039BD21C1
MKSLKFLPTVGRLLLIAFFVSITACENEIADNTDPNVGIETAEDDIPFEKIAENSFNILENKYEPRPPVEAPGEKPTKDATSITSKSNAAPQWTVFRVNTNDRRNINYGLFGANNDWRFIPDSDFNRNFIPSMRNISGNGLRYPGGWESEYYDANTNTTPGWNNTPAQAGASVNSLINNDIGVLSIVIPTVDAMNRPLWDPTWWAAIQTLKTKANTIIDRVGAYRIDYVEIGNEWWLQWGGGVSRFDKVRKYGQIAKLLARHLKQRYGNDFKILVNGDYTVPSEFGTIKTIFGNELNNIDGSALHPYAGYNSFTHNLNNLENLINDCKYYLGRNYVTQSEWAPSKAYNNNRVYAQAANIMVDMFHKFARTNSNAAAYWAPENSTLPGLGLFNSTASNVNYPQAQIFKSMSDSFSGQAIYNSEDFGSQRQGIIKMASRISGKQVALWISGFDVGDTDVWIDFPGRSVRSVWSTIYYPSTYNGDQPQPMGHYYNDWWRSTTGIGVKLNSWRKYGIAFVILDLY